MVVSRVAKENRPRDDYQESFTRTTTVKNWTTKLTFLRV